MSAVLGSVFLVLISSVSDPHALEKLEQKASYEFQNKSVYSVLETISRDFNIAISAPLDQLQQKVTKSYKDTAIERIINDMVKTHNHTIVWQYKNRQIVGIDIQLVMPEETGAVSRAPSGFKPTGQSQINAPALQGGIRPGYSTGSQGHNRHGGPSRVNSDNGGKRIIPPPQPSLEGLPEGVELPPSMPAGPQMRRTP